MTDVRDIFDGEHLNRLASALDNEAFQATITPGKISEAAGLVELKLGAMFGYEEWVTDLDFDEEINGNSQFSKTLDRKSAHVFDQWQAYINVAWRYRRIDLRDLMLTTAVGLWARRPTELRHLLCIDGITSVLNYQAIDSNAWPRRIQDTVSRALILIARQSGRADIENAMQYVEEIRNLQKDLEKDWLSETHNVEQSALSLLALYHTAQAAIVLTHYVLTGVYTGARGQSVNVGTELQTLLRKSFEYANLTSDPELITWIRSVTLIITKLRSDSIWASGYNINQKIDQLVQCTWGKRPGRHEAGWGWL
mgnify:CR=1 FL=1